MSSRVMSMVGAAVASTGVVFASLSFPAPQAQAAVDGINPVVVEDDDPYNANFLAFIETDVAVRGGESEGSIAMGGDLSMTASYNVMRESAGSYYRQTPTGPGDAQPTTLYVGGDVDWARSTTGILRVLDQGFMKVSGEDNDVVFRNPNQPQVVAPGAGIDSDPLLEGTAAQSEVSIRDADGLGLDIGRAFTAYREITQQLDQCTATVETNTDEQSGQLRVTLTEGETNVLDLTTDQLGSLSEIQFTGGVVPSQSTVLLVNVTGDTTYSGPFVQLAGGSGETAPFTLWNFPDATSLTFTSGDSVNGTVYAPNADLRFATGSNLQGNVIASSFVHNGTSATGGATTSGELHDYPFSATIDCSSPLPPTSAPTTDPTTAPTTVPTSEPTTAPTTEPTTVPTTVPTETPSVAPATATAPTDGPSQGVAGEAEGSLPNTGGAAGWLLPTGIALVLGGGALSAMALRRRRSEA